MTLLKKYWPHLGLFASLMIILSLVLGIVSIEHFNSLLWIHLALLMIHQFEEYVYPGGFKTFYNNHIYNKNKTLRYPLNENGILLVNVIIAWPIYLASAILGPNQLYLVNTLLGVTLLNGFLHLIMSIKLQAYNPGLISGLFLFIPFSFYALYKINFGTSVYIKLISIIFFVIATITVPISIYLTNLNTDKHQ